MLKNFRLIALVFVVMTSCFEVVAQTDNYKDVLLNGKPAKLNLITGEVTYTNGEVATSRAAKKIKDSVLESRTEIKTNLIVDMDATDLKTSKKSERDSIQTKESLARASTEQLKPPHSQHEADDLSNSEIQKMESYSDNSDANVDSYGKEPLRTTIAYHTVSKGETLYALSKRYNTTVGKILIANDLDTTIIKVGQKLKIEYQTSNDATIRTVWTVSEGDTLFNIAERNNTTVNEIKDLNNLESDVIKIGQKLQLMQNSTVTKK